MPPTFEQSKDDIARLVKHFATNQAAYRATTYKEAHARQEFIDPLFVALGWDVHNTQHAAPDYREVVVEDTVEIQGQKKAPDYVFRVGRERKFFVEAKKPGVDLKKDPLPAYQLRRYGWTAKLPLSLLTDFEELAVYDCRIRPSEKDKATTARINYFAFKEYPDRWREVWDIFSREAILGGAFDQYAQAGKSKRGTSEVDAEFLKEIESWRDALARNLAQQNKSLTIDELNDAVQRTIDRIIFLRMTEDRGMEDYGRLLRLSEGDSIYKGLVALFRHADAKYNSGLFDFSREGDQLTPGLTLEDKALRPILANLYFPQSPYEFSVLPVEILGNVYEQFLGKVIRLTPSHQAKVEEKPEVKKAGGVYYTPAYIVEYIVKNTVGKLVEGKSPLQLRGFRVLDPACGSGSFLIGAYQFLLDYYLTWYTANTPEKHRKAVWQLGDSWRLTAVEKKRILTEHIFGVDIDRQAVEVTKLSLLLKVLETESDESMGKQTAMFQEEAKERALPNLDRNIKCGNSLIGPDYFSGQMLLDKAELRRVNPFDWEREFPEAMRAGGFDCVIGNPPYIRIQTMKEWASLEVEIYKKIFTAASSGNYDIYVVFVEKGLSLLNKRGRLGFILPHKFFNAQYGEPLRSLLANGQHLAEVIHFGDQQVFSGATTYTCLLFLDKTGASECHFIKVDDLTAWRSTGTATEGTIQAANITAAEWNFAVGENAALFEKLSKMPTKLGDVANIFVGLQTSADTVFLFKDVPSSTSKLKKVHSKELDEDLLLESELLKPVVRSGEIGRYWANPTAYVLFPYQMEKGKARLIPESDFKKKYPKAWEYLIRNKQLLAGREHGKFKDTGWYQLYPKNLDLWERPKILMPYMITKLSAYYDTDDMYFVNVTTGGFGVRVDSKLGALEYFTGLLNSRLLNWFFKQVSTTFHGGYFAANKQFLVQLPIRPTNISDPADKAQHDQLVKLVEQMVDLHKRLAAAQDESERGRLQRLIDSNDQQIDALVYELYELTPEEIAIVEGRAA